MIFTFFPRRSVTCLLHANKTDLYFKSNLTRDIITSRSVRFEKGDLLLLYTDRIIHAANASGNRFGLERLKRLLVKVYRTTWNFSASCNQGGISPFRDPMNRKIYHVYKERWGELVSEQRESCISSTGIKSTRGAFGFGLCQ